MGADEADHISARFTAAAGARELDRFILQDSTAGGDGHLPGEEAPCPGWLGRCPVLKTSLQNTTVHEPERNKKEVTFKIKAQTDFFLTTNIHSNVVTERV